MPAYNAGDRIRSTIKSLGANSEPFDLFIVDDGSQPPLSETMGAPPPNAKILRLDQNVGIAAALNHGLTEILKHDYTYVARMDVGDIAHPDRFAKQVAFLQSHPEIGLVGCWISFVDENSRESLFHLNHPTTDADIRDALHFNLCITHAAMMFRTDAIRAIGGYSTEFPICEDYEIVLRLAQIAKMANIPEYLMECELGAGGLSIRKRRTQQFSRLRLQVRHLQPLQRHSWLGIIRSLVLLISPTKLLHNIKGRLKKYHPIDTSGNTMSNQPGQPDK
ncbi:MAG: glycosyltransferase [Rhodospirillales bacterium]|nr:glycosyltransferase [Rhodospirillales bacterium]